MELKICSVFWHCLRLCVLASPNLQHAESRRSPCAPKWWHKLTAGFQQVVPIRPWLPLCFLNCSRRYSGYDFGFIKSRSSRKAGLVHGDSVDEQFWFVFSSHLLWGKSSWWICVTWAVKWGNSLHFPGLLQEQSSLSQWCHSFKTLDKCMATLSWIDGISLTIGEIYPSLSAHYMHHSLGEKGEAKLHRCLWISTSDVGWRGITRALINCPVQNACVFMCDCFVVPLRYAVKCCMFRQLLKKDPGVLKCH